MLERLVGFAVIIASGAILIAIKMLDLPGVVTFVGVVGTAALCLGGIVILFAEEPLRFLHARERKAVKNAKASEAAMSYRKLDSIHLR